MKSLCEIKSIQEYISKGPFRMRIETQSYRWYRACRVGGSSPWLLFPFSRSPTAGGKWPQTRMRSFEFSEHLHLYSVKALSPVTWYQTVLQKAPILKVKGLSSQNSRPPWQLGPKVKSSTVKSWKSRRLGKFLRPSFSLPHLSVSGSLRNSLANLTRSFTTDKQ